MKPHSLEYENAMKKDLKRALCADTPSNSCIK